MINLNELREGMILISRESDPLWAEEPNKRDRVLIGVVVAIDCEKGEVTLRLKRELRIFKPEDLWYLPYEKEYADTPDSKEEKLMGFIVGIDEGQVGTFGIREAATLFKQRGIRPIKVQELIEAL